MFKRSVIRKKNEIKVEISYKKICHDHQFRGFIVYDVIMNVKLHSRQYLKMY